MPLKDTIRVVNSSKRRIKLFIDFWNVVINARNLCNEFDVDINWNKLSVFLVGATRQGYQDETSGELAGCYIFGSISNSNPNEKALSEKILDNFGSEPGLFFNFAPRLPKQSATKCPNCEAQFKTRSESGIDVLLAVEMIKHAAMREHEYLGLVSSDRDFLPLLSYLRDQGQRVLHVSPGKPDREMRSATWAQVDLTELYPNFCTIRHEGYIILTAPGRENLVEEILSAATVDRGKFKIIDITKKNEISDKDLAFILRSKNIYWRQSGESSIIFEYPHPLLSNNISIFRQNLENGSIDGYLPYVLRDGETEIYFGYDSMHRWICPSNSKNDWRNILNSI